MSWASKYLFGPIRDAFTQAVAVGGPASQPAAQTATQNLTQAQSLIEASVTSLATIAVNAVLGLIPKGQGTAIAPIADAFLAEVISQLVAHQNAPPSGPADPIPAPPPS